MTEAFLRLYTTYREEQLALADRGPALAGVASLSGAEGLTPTIPSRKSGASWPPAATVSPTSTTRPSASPSCRRPERIRRTPQSSHNLRVRHLPPGRDGRLRATARPAPQQFLLDDALDAASQNFQLAQQLAYLEMGDEIGAALSRHFATESGERLTRRALASYAAAALLMPYSAFARAAETRRYDVEALARQFGASFEQTAHRLTTLQKPGHERVPFFFIRVDPAGNVSKRLDGAGFPFARHGGGCPLWSVHGVFRTPRQIVTQWLELPDGQRFFSIARTVTAGGGRLAHRAWSAPSRSAALPSMRGS